MKPCQHCGHPLENKAQACPNCRRPWVDIGIPLPGPEKELQNQPVPRMSFWEVLLTDTVIIFAAGGAGYLLLGKPGFFIAIILVLAVLALAAGDFLPG